MARKKNKGIMWLIGQVIYHMVYFVYVIFRLLCWPVLGNPRLKTVEKVKMVERNGPNITVKPSTFVNRLWSRVHKDDKEIIKNNREAKSTFRLGVIIALEAVGTDPKLVECIAEQVELK